MLLERAPAGTGVGEAIERLAGMQAQEAKHPFIGLWTRVEGFAPEDLREALKARDVVRATLMRATLHLASVRHYLAWRGALQPMLTKAMEGALRGRMDGLDVPALVPVARKLLDERPRDFTELRAELSAAFPEVNERALGYAVRTNLPLVMVPTDDQWAFPQAAKFAPAETWLKKKPGDGDAETLVLDYLAAFGPASVADFQTWSGLPKMKDAFDRVRPQLESFTGPGSKRELFDLPDAPRPDADVEAPPRFLPEFDNLVLAHADRTRVLPEAHRGEVVTKNLRVRATFLLDGMVAGTWRIARKSKSATLELSPFGRLPRGAKQALTEEGERLLRFAEPEAQTVTVKLAAG